MRLFEAILEANHRAISGDQNVGVQPADFADALPVIALTCVDPRLNPLIPEVLGIREEDFIWLRNAGNIITSSLSSTMRSLALACAVKGGKEISVIGHTDCRICQTSMMQLLERFQALGISRSSLPENLTEFLGLFASERQNVIKATDLVRRSPLIGPKIPVHGLLVDIQTGSLEWLVNGYQTLGAPLTQPSAFSKKLEAAEGIVSKLTGFDIGEVKIPETKIGDIKFPETKVGDFIAKIQELLPQNRLNQSSEPEIEAEITEPIQEELNSPPPLPKKTPPPIITQPKLSSKKKSKTYPLHWSDVKKEMDKMRKR